MTQVAAPELLLGLAAQRIGAGIDVFDRDLGAALATHRLDPVERGAVEGIDREHLVEGLERSEPVLALLVFLRQVGHLSHELAAQLVPGARFAVECRQSLDHLVALSGQHRRPVVCVDDVEPAVQRVDGLVDLAAGLREVGQQAQGNQAAIVELERVAHRRERGAGVVRLGQRDRARDVWTMLMVVLRLCVGSHDEQGDEGERAGGHPVAHPKDLARIASRPVV